MELLKRLQSHELFKNHILAGGTALALQLGHRMSIDIDLFTFDGQDNNALLNYFDENYGSAEILHNNQGILQMVVNNIKVDMVHIRGKLLEPPVNENGLRILGIKDIAAMKLLAITDRKEPKDYIDIAWILKNITLEEMLECYREKYQKTDVFNVKKALAEVNRVNPYHWEKIKMIKKDIYLSDVPKIIRMEIIKYNEKHEITKRRFGFFKRKRDKE
jgi:predicted nucleotidyltransferase component of viral defense system